MYIYHYYINCIFCDVRFILEYTKLKCDNVIVGVNQFRWGIEHKVLLDGVNGTCYVFTWLKWHDSITKMGKYLKLRNTSITYLIIILFINNLFYLFFLQRYIQLGYIKK